MTVATFASPAAISAVPTPPLPCASAPLASAPPSISPTRPCASAAVLAVPSPMLGASGGSDVEEEGAAAALAFGDDENMLVAA